MAVPQSQSLSSGYRYLLENLEFLRKYIPKLEATIQREKEQLATEQRAHSLEMVKLPVSLRPMDAPYWRRREEEISKKERCLKAAKAKLREFEKNES